MYFYCLAIVYIVFFVFLVHNVCMLAICTVFAIVVNFCICLTEMAAWLVANGPISIGINAIMMQVGHNYYNNIIMFYHPLICKNVFLNQGMSVVWHLLSNTPFTQPFPKIPRQRTQYSKFLVPTGTQRKRKGYRETVKGLNPDLCIIMLYSVHGFIYFILLHEKFLQFAWLRRVVFQLNLKYLHVKITNLFWVVV